jgi:ATP-binding cassette, subfamily B, bacterial
MTIEPLIKISNISFRYQVDYIFQNLSLEFYPMQTIALIGPTGGGKTTLASLISLLYKPESGDFDVFGNKISFSKSLDQNIIEDYQKKIGFILQEPNLFSGSLAYNLLYGNNFLVKDKNYGNENLIKILSENSNYPDIIKFFPELEIEIDPNKTSLSLGQKQLISFFRIILREPEILILDEATANIDTITETAIETIISKQSQIKLKIIIAHRLNTVKNADKVFYINSGQVKDITNEFKV